MLRNITPWVVILSLLGAGAVLAAQAEPTVQEIYAAAQSGRIAQAEQMVNQVLQDHPKSAKAHYVAAEVYARGGDFSIARREFAAAESLQPGLPFAQHESVAALRAELAQSRFVPRALQQTPYAVYAPRARPRSGVSWGTVLIVIAGIVILWAFVRRRMQHPVYPPYPGQPMGGVGPMGTGGGVVPPYPYGGGPGSGSGLMGSLGTGLAVGAGVAAGEELVRHVLGGSQGGLIPPANAGEVIDPSQANPDMGGADFGVSDGSSWDDGSGGGDFGIGGDSGSGGGDDWT
ncbi:MAG TPA: tetratricopeptide repeat protein [Steroidobacteraceae bacterium]|nr:tetratricopeptide repeat protein [Steroidobacteraceae bacterium]